MLPSELKLTSLGHCYVHLPETFVSREPAVKGGAIISIKSIQTDHELFVMWNGQLTSGEHVELDLNFGRANKLSDELVIINTIDNPDLRECSSCRVELVDSSEYSILSEHSEANVLDTCRLIYKGLIIPIVISQHVRVLVRVTSFEPGDKPQVLLSKWSELTFIHDLDEIPKVPINGQSKSDKDKLLSFERQSIPFLNCALGHNAPQPKFHLGSMLICGQRGSGKTYVLKKILNNYDSYYCEYFNCKQLRAKRPENVKKMLNEIIARAKGSEKQTASIIALDDIDSFLEFSHKDEDEQGHEVLYRKRLVAQFCLFLKQVEREDTDDFQIRNGKARVIVIAACRSLDLLHERLSSGIGRRYFSEILSLSTPSLSSKVEILKDIIAENSHHIDCSVHDYSDLEKIAQNCASFMPLDLKRLYERALINACSRSSLEFSSDPVSMQLEDFLISIVGYIPINLRNIPLQPKMSFRTFSKIGGMKEVKESLMKTILFPIKFPKLYERCPLKMQSSILLYGPPGCGKTMVAEALSSLEGLNSICVRGPELLSKYIGSSEASVRDLFKRAQLARPCVIFFDEFESLVAKRGSDSTGVTDRVVNQFLTILDGVERLSRDVFIIAATSRPDMIDPAMLRPGRLDKHIYCPLPDKSSRLEIIQVLSESMDIEKNIDFEEWATRLEKFTGADIQALLCSAQLKSLNEMIATSKVTSNGSCGSCPSNDKLKIIVSQKHLEDSFEEIKPNIYLNYETLLQRYPRTMGRANRQISARATLA